MFEDETKAGRRQGDVLLVPVDVIPVNVTPVPSEGGRLILALGEATGHHHSCRSSPQIAMFREDGRGDGTYLTAVPGNAPPLTHQQHTAHELVTDKYQVRIQRSYRAGMARRVKD